MKKHHRDSQGRAIRFFDIPRVKKRLYIKSFFARAAAAAVLAAGELRIKSIRSTNGGIPQKAMAIESTVIDAHIGALRAYNHYMGRNINEKVAQG